MKEKTLTADMKWSFSKLSLFQECPRAFWLQYMLDPPLAQQDNAFSDYGTLCHEILEDWAKGRLTTDKMADAWEQRYPTSVVHSYPPFPKGYEEKSYAQAMEYFKNFDGFGDQYDIVSAEEKFEISIGTYRFVGVSDLILRDRETDGLVVIDHKTKSAKSMKQDYDLYIHQLYIYAQHVYQKYGCYPQEIRFNMIKEPSATIIEKFDKSKLDATLRWVEDTIDMIYLESEWVAQRAVEITNGKSDFFCKFICGTFAYCDEAQQAIMSKRRG